MTKFIRNSHECTKSELDLFFVPPTNTSIESGGWSQHHPISVIDNHNGPIEFNIVSSENEYIHLCKTLLYLSVEFVKTKEIKNESTTNNDFGPVNNLASSLFSQIDVSLKNESIETSNKTYAYKAYISDLLNFGTEAKTTHMQTSLFYKDTAGFMDSLNFDEDKKENQGLLARTKLIKNGNGSIELLSRLYSDIFNSDRYLINGIDMNIKLIRNVPEFFLMKANDSLEINVKINNAILYVRKAKISPSILLAHSLALEKATAKYPIKRVIVNTYTISQNVQNFTTPNLSSSVLPLRVIVGMVDSKAFNGSYKHNPFNFQHFNLRQLQLTLDSKNIPYYKGLEFDFNSKKCLRGYFTLFEGIDGPVFLNGNDISREDYSEGYTLFVFDISPDLCSGDHFNLLKTGELVLDLSFHENLNKTITLVVFMEFDNMIEINATRKVFKDYQI